MRRDGVALSIPILVALGAAPALGAEFSARIVDGLGRPIEGVAVEVGMFREDAGGKYRSVVLLTMRSDGDGRARGDYDEEAARASRGRFVELKKEGYVTYMTTGRFGPEYEMRRVFPSEALDRVVQLPEGDQPAALRELLAGSGDWEPDAVFTDDDLFRPALRRLADDPKVGDRAIALLASIGEPEDMRWIAEHAPASRSEGWKERVRESWLDEAFLVPTTQEEWTFLRRCALGEVGDGGAWAGAFQTLWFHPTMRGRWILEEVRARYPTRGDEVADALAYAATRPGLPEGRDLIGLARRVASAIGPGMRTEAGPPRYNARGDKARVPLELVEGRCLFAYTATFQKVEGVWHLRGLGQPTHATLAVELGPEARDR